MQHTVSQFCDAHHLETTTDIRYMDLVCEIGELGKELLKGSEYGHKTHENTPALEMEMGDCIFSLVALCNALHIDMDVALGKALAKYQARFIEKGHIGSEE